MEKEAFTGERFIPGIQDEMLSMEHYQRYESIRQIVRGKLVLDAACGEGYGSRILADEAEQVIGLDISEETIMRAEAKYGQTENLVYKVGSIVELPLEDHSVDIVVSFETIEHVSEELQKSFLMEIGRVLKEDGLLIMSTPNKKIYSDLYNYHNEFHVKEFYEDEFVDFLKSSFKNVRLFYQYFEVAGIIDSGRGVLGNSAYRRAKDYEGEGKYIIALASNVALGEKEINSVEIGKTTRYQDGITRILSLQREEEERNDHIKKLDGELEEKGKYIFKLQEENSSLGNSLREADLNLKEQSRLGNIAEREKAELEKLIQIKDQRIGELEKVVAAKEALVEVVGKEKEKLIGALKASEEKAEKYATALAVKEEESARLHDDKKKEINKLLLTLNERIAAQNELRDMLETELRNKEGHIQQLLEVERAYEREKKTRGYRFCEWIRKVIAFFIPPNSKREFFLYVLIQCFKQPSLMFRMINPTRIKTFLQVSKKEGMDAVWYNYRLTEDFEKMNMAQGPEKKLAEAAVEEKDISECKVLEFTQWKNPTVSIVIPVYNQFGYTYNCLESILKNSGDVKYEIIIADDCSTDQTKALNTVAHGIKIIRNRSNLRFLKNCNNAAKHAKGEYILFLNNDTQVQENWLSPLVSLIESDAAIGMVGSKLVYPDGYLQEAGGIVWKDGSAWNYGQRKRPEDPEYNYVKDADYISGAAIMIRKSLWKSIGGFDERFAPAYYEDTDLAFEVRKHGFRVVYQPLSVVVHFEGISNGTDVKEGLKAYQVENQKKFLEKWKDVLEKEHFPNGEDVFLAKDRSRFKKQILVVDHYVPNYDKDAGGKCTYMYLKTFLKLGMKVTFIGDNFAKMEPYATELNQLGIEILYGNYYYNNWQEWLKDNLKYFDFVYLQRPHISVKYIDIVKQYGRAKVFYFAHDLHHLREYRQYQLDHNPETLKSSERWKAIEYELFSKADVGHVVGSYEQGIMQKAFPDKPIRNIPLYIYEDELTDIQKDFSKREDIMYVGGFGHPPNEDAVLWFANEVYPKVLEKYPHMKWHVVGSKVTKAVQALANDNILIEGFQPDEELHRLYRECRMAIVPLRYGAGVKGKVVESAYFQIPLITTSIGAEGLNCEDNTFVIEDDADKMAEKICSLYEDYDALKEMSDKGKVFIRKNFTLKAAEDILLADMEL